MRAAATGTRRVTRARGEADGCGSGEDVLARPRAILSAGLDMLRRVLDKTQDELLAENRRLVSELQVALARFDASAEDQATLERSARQLDELFLLVVAGEFNAGKSAFINALLGG